MPPRIFKDVHFVAIVMIATIGAMMYYSMTVLWPTIIGTVYTTDVVQIGWQSSVIGGGVLLGQTISGFTISHVSKVKIQTVIASVLGTAFFGSLASVSPSMHGSFLALGILGTVSIGFVDNISFPGVTLLFEAQDIGLATGVLGSIRAMGGAIAQALYVSILNTKLTHYLSTNVVPAATQAGLPRSSLQALFAGIIAGNISSVPGMTPEIITMIEQQVQRSYVQSFQIVFLATIPFGALLIGFACLVPNMEEHLQGNVARRLQSKGGSLAASNP